MQTTQTLSSFDQFSNLLLQDTVERRMVVVDDKNVDNASVGDATPTCFYHDIPLGVFIVRGDSVVLMGQVSSGHDDDNDDEAMGGMMSPYNNNMMMMGFYNQGVGNKMHMKRVDFEELEQLQKRGDLRKPLEWDFDADLVA
jgi:small nuclear ribonucleoprotein (snRNP)-like protein